jgi:hypothetical protein
MPHMVARAPMSSYPSSEKRRVLATSRLWGPGIRWCHWQGQLRILFHPRGLVDARVPSRPYARICRNRSRDDQAPEKSPLQSRNSLPIFMSAVTRKPTHQHDWLRTILHHLKRLLEDLLFPLRMHFGRKIMYDCRRKIVQTSSNELIKGPCREQEPEAMLYAASHTSVSLPSVHRTYRRRDGMYIAMEFVKGQSLDHIWDGMDEEEKRKAVEEIWKQVEMLRDCEPDEGLGVKVDSTEGGDVVDGILRLAPVGPFATVEAFKESCLRGHPNLAAYQDLWEHDDDDGLRKDSRSVFSHADRSPRNIIQRESDSL